MKIIFLINSLGKGGAELQLVNLAKMLKYHDHDVKVAVGYSGGAYHTELNNLGIKVIELNKKIGIDVFFIFRFFKLLRNEHPDIVHSYMGASNLVASVSKIFFQKTKVVWGVRAAYMDLTKYSWLSRLVYKVEPYFSQKADLIITNSYAAKQVLLLRGIHKDKIKVIHNGIDVEKFPRKHNSSNHGSPNRIIGTASRIDPMKGYEVFLDAIELFIQRYREYSVHFVVAGGSDNKYLEALQNKASSKGIHEYISWIGEQGEMSQIYRSFDIYSSNSLGESFSNSICEAMSSGIPCVVTDVGDSAKIVGETGIVVKPNCSEALADAWQQMLKRNLILEGEKARERISKCFSIEQLGVNTEKVLIDLLNESGYDKKQN